MRWALLAFVIACGGDPATPREWASGPALPEPLANNAVAGLELEGGCMVFSMLGIDASLAGSGAHNRAYRIRSVDDAWLALPDVPGPGRLAASAVGLRGAVYVLGGYSIGPGGTETSHDSLQYFDLSTGQWVDAAPLPIPIDDAVAVAWRDRWIVVVSGWSNTGNLDAVQIYDVESNTWAMGTPFPGTPAFGHAGAISGDTLVVIDGAASTSGFPIVAQSWRGELDPDDPTQIAWTELGVHPGPARYRAAGGTEPSGRLWFHGGTETTYNFDGLAYADGSPATPIATTLTFDPATDAFAELGQPKPTATMDHRSLARCGDAQYSVGGMVAGPAASTEVWIR